jgi:hypothetical protein
MSSCVPASRIGEEPGNERLQRSWVNRCRIRPYLIKAAAQAPPRPDAHVAGVRPDGRSRRGAPSWQAMGIRP